MGGSLTVESTVGQGSVFHLRFADVPVSGLSPVGDHAEPGGAVDFDDFAPTTLLVVDDNHANRALMAGISGSAGASAKGKTRRGLARYSNARDGRANDPGGDSQAGKHGVAAGHRCHRFQQGRRRNRTAAPVQRLHSQAFLPANADAGSAGFQPAVSPISNRPAVELSGCPSCLAPQVGNLRYSRLEICATNCSLPIGWSLAGLSTRCSSANLRAFCTILL